MHSAFGIDHGEISKGMLGALPYKAEAAAYKVAAKVGNSSKRGVMLNNASKANRDASRVRSGQRARGSFGSGFKRP